MTHVDVFLSRKSRTTDPVFKFDKRNFKWYYLNWVKLSILCS